MTETETLEDSVRGDLLGAFRQIEPDSIQMAYQICNDRLKKLRELGILDKQGNVDAKKLKDALKRDSLLFDLSGWTGTGAMYNVENGRAVLYLSNGIKHNLVLRPENIEEAVKQLSIDYTGNEWFKPNVYKPFDRDASDVISSVSAGTTARVEYDANTLRLVKYNDKNNWSHFVIDTEKYANSVEEGGLNDDQRELAERVWGNGRAYNKETGFSVEFKQYMAVLKAAGKDTTQFTILDPEYLKQNAREGAICCESWLNNMYFNSNFCAGGGPDVRTVSGGLRGELKNDDASNAQKTPEEKDKPKIEENTMTETLEGRIERVEDSGNLLENLKRIRPDSWQTAAEVFKAWNKYTPVEEVITANLAVYRLDENGEAVFELLGREGNPFMDESLREEAYTRTLPIEFFLLESTQSRKIKQIKAANKVTIHYLGLRIKTDGFDDKSGYVEFDGNNTDEEKKLFEAVYGTANPGNGKRVYLFKKEVVERRLKYDPDDFFMRTCYFLRNQSFVANGTGIYGCHGAVYGVRLGNVAKGAASEKDVSGSRENK